jgi:hypothetical protein
MRSFGPGVRRYVPRVGGIRLCPRAPLKVSARRDQPHWGGPPSILGASCRAQGERSCGSRSWLGSAPAYIQENLGRLARRVQDLEDALQSAHSLNSAADHPLLEERLLRIKDPFLSAEYVLRPEGSPNGTVEHPQATLGSLFVTQQGRVKYIGPGALLDVSSSPRKRDAYSLAF